MFKVRNMITVLLIIGLLTFGAFTGFAQDQEKDPTQNRREIMPARTSNTKTFRNEDGTETMRFSYAPLHYQDENGAWQEIDNTIEETATEKDEDGTVFGYRAFKGPMRTLLPKRGNGWVRLSSGNSSLSYKLLGNNQSFGKRKQNQITATNVWKNSDIFYTFRGDALKEEIVLKNPDIPQSFEFLVRLNNLTMVQNGNKEYIFTNPQGKDEFVIPKFIMIDALGKTSGDIEVRIENLGRNTSRWTVIPNQGWLTAYDRAYPVILDPTTYKVVGDAQRNAGDNYYFFLYIPTDYPAQGTYNYSMGSRNGTRSLNDPNDITPKDYPVQVTYKAWFGDGGTDPGSDPKGATFTEFIPPFFRVTDWDPANTTAASRGSARGIYLKRLEDGRNVYHTFKSSQVPGKCSGTFQIDRKRAALVEMRSGKWDWWRTISWGADCGFEITFQNENISPPEPGLELLPPETYDTSVTLAWQPPIDEANPGAIAGGIKGYYLQQSTNPEFTANVTIKDVGNVTSYTFNGLSMGITYYYRVYAQDMDLNPTSQDPYDPATNPNGIRWSRITRTKCVAAQAAGGPAQPAIDSLTPGNNLGQYYSSSRFPSIGWAYSSAQTSAQLAVVQYLTSPGALTEYPALNIDGTANRYETAWNLPDGKYIIYLRTADGVSWSPWSAGTIVTIDTAPPVISDVADENVYNTSNIEINFSTNEETIYDLYWGDSPDTISLYPGVTEYESGVRSRTVYGGAYPLGVERYYQIKCRDKAGNESITPVYQVGTGTGSLAENADPDHFGVESYWAFQDFDLGKAGIAKVNLNNGNLLITTMDFSLPGRGFPLTLVRYYNSLAEYSGIFGKGWRCNYEIYLQQTGSTNQDIYIHDPDGSRHLFVYNLITGLFTRPAGDYRRVVKNFDGTYQVIEKNGTIYYFDVPANGISKLTAMEDRFGNKLTLSYSNGLLTSVQEPSGYRRANFQYMTMGGISYLYMIDFTPREGSNPSRSISYTYYDRNLYHVYYPYNGAGKIEVGYDYDTFMGILIGAKVFRMDAPSNVKNATSFAYKSCKRSVASITTSFDTYQENFVDFSYGPSVKTPVLYKFNYDGPTTVMTDPKAQKYTFTFNNGLCRSVQRPLCTYPVNYTYDGDMNLLTAAQTKLVYDGSTEALQEVVTENTYYPNGNLRSVTLDKTGKKLTTAITYELSHRNVQTDTESITDPRNKTVNYINQYDPDTGKLTSLTIDPEDDYRITHTFNQYGERTDKDVILDSNPSVSKYHFGYGYLNGLLHTLSNKYGTAIYDYTVYGELKMTTDANGVTQEYNIDPGTGWTNSVPAPSVGTSAFEPYNAVNDRRRFEYDFNGNKTKEYDAKNHSTTYLYDALNHQYRVQSPYIAGVTQYNSYSRYDANGNLLAVRDYNGISTLYEYDCLNRRTKVKDYSGNIQEELTYDEAGRIKNCYDAKRNLTVNYYDSVDNLVRTDYYEGGVNKSTVTYEYDPNGNLTRKTAPLSSGIPDETGQLITTYGYDASNRPVSIITTCAGNSKYNQTLEYTYEAGQLKTMTVKVADGAPQTYRYSYDDAQRLESIINPADQKFTFGYFSGGQRKFKSVYTERTDTDPFMTVEYQYDAAYLLKHLNYRWDTYKVDQEYVYDPTDKIIDNRLEYDISAPEVIEYLKAQLPPNNSSTVPYIGGSGHNKYTYDELGRLTSSDIRVISPVLKYDSYIKTFTRRQSTSFSIDGNSNPDGKTITDYENDGENEGIVNITHESNTSNPLNQIVRRTISKSDRSTPDYAINLRYLETGGLELEDYPDQIRATDSQYQYGLDNQLIRTYCKTDSTYQRITVPPVNAPVEVSCFYSSKKCYTYELGGDLLRVKSEVHDSTNPYYGYSYGYSYKYDDYFYQSHDGVVAERHDDAGAMKYFTRLGGELLACDNNGQTYFYIQNIRGDVIMLVDWSGMVKSIRDYDASGQMLSQASPERDPFGFTGGLDAGNGLWKLGARFYDSGKGSFIQQDRYLGDPNDPLSLNRYVYCGLDPVNFVDPTGFSRTGTAALGLSWLTLIDGPFIPVGDIIYGGIVLGIAIGEYGPMLIDLGSKMYQSANSGGASGDSSGGFDPGKWGKGNCKTSLESLQRHFDKHGAEVGAKDIEQYLRKAEAFKSNLKGATSYEIDGYTEGVVRYVKNGKYIDLAPDGTIISFGAR